MVSEASFNSQKDNSAWIRIPDPGGKKAPDLGSGTLV
jgi:hypothetical protein